MEPHCWNLRTYYLAEITVEAVIIVILGYWFFYIFIEFLPRFIESIRSTENLEILPKPSYYGIYR